MSGTAHDPIVLCQAAPVWFLITKFMEVKMFNLQIVLGHLGNDPNMRVRHVA